MLLPSCFVLFALIPIFNDRGCFQVSGESLVVYSWLLEGSKASQLHCWGECHLRVTLGSQLWEPWGHTLDLSPGAGQVPEKCLPIISHGETGCPKHSGAQGRAACGRLHSGLLLGCAHHWLRGLLSRFSYYHLSVCFPASEIVLLLYCPLFVFVC